MKAEQIMESGDFKKCVEFHGHLCPGVSIGYRAAKAGMEWLKANRAEDEQFVAIAEPNACSADSIQVLTGCTFGKVNFIHKDYGKHAFTFIGRQSGQAVRVALKAGAFMPDERQLELMAKIRNEQATEGEREEFRKIHLKRSHDVLEKAVEDLFTIEPVQISIPRMARAMPSQICSRCGEPTMSTKLMDIAGLKVCPGCASAE
jgi:formylmethanofuran dehydrogenase subunit E